jgi:methionyl-tRNA synthetase
MLPAIEMSYGDYIMPSNIPANEFLNLEGQKFSKSRNWSIDLQDFITDFHTTQSVDALRYTLASILPENKDADFTWKDFQAKTNNELAAILGNFINRTLQFTMKNMNGKVPTLSKKYVGLSSILKQIVIYYFNNIPKTTEELKNYCKTEFVEILSQNDINLFSNFIIGINKISYLYSKFKIKDAVAETMNLARAANKYFNDEEPWNTIKTDNTDYCHKTIYICCQVVYILSILFSPIIPYTSAKIQGFFGLHPILGNANNGLKTTNYIRKLFYFNIHEGLEIIHPTILFSQIEDKDIETQIAKLGVN